jgi:transcriptional regulator with XRE-family HTH domain
MNVMKSGKRDQKAIWREFGPWLRRQREIVGKTRKEVAAEVDIHPVQLARIETGESGTRQDTLDALIQCLNLDPEDTYNHAGLRPESSQGTQKKTKADDTEKVILGALMQKKNADGLSDEARNILKKLSEE